MIQVTVYREDKLQRNSSSLGKNALLMSEFREEWSDCFKLIGQQQEGNLWTVQHRRSH